MDDEGQQFWSGTRRPPKTLQYNPNVSPSNASQLEINENYVTFVASAARLRAESLVGDHYSAPDTVFSKEEVEETLRSADFSSFFSKKQPSGENSAVAHVRKLIDVDLSNNNRPLRRWDVLEFEKDDETNGHVDFVSSASNLRAISYGIAPVDTMETRRVAGKIVPAMITTTAFVAALSCVELLKASQKAPLVCHRNSFINLAMPFFAFTVPMEAERIIGFRGKHFTLWDRLTIQEKRKHVDRGGITMRSLLRRLRALASSYPETVAVSSISCGPYLLYADFLNDIDKNLLKKSVWDVVSDAIESGISFENDFKRDHDDSKVTYYDRVNKYVDLTVAALDLDTGDEVELPLVRLKRFHQAEG
jgi:ubiquitin-activating enzyme E1